MTYGVILLIVLFQPELRRALEQLGTNKFIRFFGINSDQNTKMKILNEFLPVLKNTVCGIPGMGALSIPDNIKAILAISIKVFEIETENIAKIL